jgi:hypothetical protein
MQLLDIKPNIATHIINEGGLKIFTNKLQDITSIELVEHTLKVIEKMAQENVHCIIASNVLMQVGRLLEFFDFTQQKSALRLMNLLVRGFSTKQDFEVFILPAATPLSNLIKYTADNNKSKEILELATNIYTSIVETITHLYDSKKEVMTQIEVLACESVVGNILYTLNAGLRSPNYAALTPRSWKNIMKVLRYFCKSSAKTCKFVVTNGLLDVLKELLLADAKVIGENFTQADLSRLRYHSTPSDTPDVISEGSVLILDAILPYNHLLIENKEDSEYIMESEKEEIIKEQQWKNFWELLLPKLIEVYQNIDSIKVKIRCLQIIDKATVICDAAAVSKMLPPQSTAQFLYSNLQLDDPVLACFVIRLAEVMFQKPGINYCSYLKSMKREGVLEEIKALQDLSYIKKKYGKICERESLEVDNPYLAYFCSYTKEVSLEEPSFTTRLGKRPYPSSKSRMCRIMFGEYIQTNTNKLLETYEVVRSSIELKEAQNDYKTCQDTAKQLKKLLKSGNSGDIDKWTKVFKGIADRLVADNFFTTYESRHTQLFVYLYYALCMTPTEYANIKKHKKEEAKDQLLKSQMQTLINKNEDLAQMIARHKTFMNIFTNTSSTPCNVYVNLGQAMIELVKKLQESIGNIEKYIEIAPRGEMYRTYDSELRVMLVYSPVSTELQSSDLKELKLPVGEIINMPLRIKAMHNLYEILHSLTFHVSRRSTFKELLKFLKQKVRADEDIISLKGERYYAMMKQGVDKVMVEDDEEDSEIIEELEERVHYLGEGINLDSDEKDFFESSQAPPLVSHADIKSDTRIGFKLFCNGVEIKNKSDHIVDSVLRARTSRLQLPHNVQGVIAFQIYEKQIKPITSHFNSLLEGEDYRFKGLSSEEQQVISLCQLELKNSIQKIKDKHVEAVMKLLKFIYCKLRINMCTCSTPYSIQVNDESFINHSLDQLIKKQFRDISIAFSNLNAETEWIKKLCCDYPFMVSKNIRLLEFKVSNFNRDRAVIALIKALRGNNLSQDLRSSRKRRKYKAIREKIIESGMIIMKSLLDKSYYLEFGFENEMGSGLGPTMEFYSLTAIELKSIKMLWRTMEDNSLFPAPLSSVEGEQAKKYFEYMGWLVARSVFDERLIDLPFAEVFWDLVKGKAMTLVDIVRVDSKLALFLFDLEKIKRQKEEIDNNPILDLKTKEEQKDVLRVKMNELALTFVLQGYDNIGLKVNGSSIALTIDNIGEYLDLTVYYTFDVTVASQVKGFIKGFSLIFPINSVNFFKPTEMEELVCGDKTEPWSLETLKESIFPVYGYDNASVQYGYFLKYLTELNKESQRRFLQYATGSPRLPIGGFASLNPKLTVAKRLTPEGEHPDEYLPSVMTCQNYVKVPEYSTYDVLREKFNYALLEGQRAFTLS